MKKIVSLLAILVTFFGTAQIVEPVKWSSSVVKVSDTEIDLIITANIENNWHLYSQYTPEGGALPLVFTFKNQKGNYVLAYQKNIDFGGGVERTLAVLNGLSDNYQTSIFKPVIKEIEKILKNDKDQFLIHIKYGLNYKDLQQI